ncbi:MAG: amidohydrolase family protein [Chloroflexi bacterium]|nr:amidohydrolase family protein [Chloroflexota bacterium]
MTILIRGGTLLPMDSGPRAMRGDLLIQGRQIVAIGKVTAPAGAQVIDATGGYVMPGLVQTHVHLVQTIFRGLAEDLSLLDWLGTRVWPLEAALDEASLRASVRLGILELLATGTTTLLDMGTTHGGDVVMDEIARSGIRARAGQAMMDTGERVPPGLIETTRASLDAAAALITRWHGHDSGRIQYAYAPRFALTCTRELLEAVATLSRMGGQLVHTHSNENVGERALIERATGRAPAAYLVETGIASDRAVLAHGVHLDAAEVDALREAGASVAHCPSSNLKLASGIADVVGLRAAGITVGIGSDGAACNNRLDAFEEMRLAALLARGRHGPDALGAWDVLRMGTTDGARALRAEREIGSLTVDKRADVLVLDGAALAPGGDPATRILYGGGSRAVRDVIVDGQILVRDGVSTRMEAAAVRAASAEAVPKLTARAGLS